VATRDDVIREIDRLSDLPILPQILIRLNKVAEDDNASVEDFGRIILKDQGLTLQVLRVVNSAFYRQQGRERTTTVSQAVLILGFNGVRRLALGMSVYDTLQSANALPGLQDLWSHSLTTAITTRLLAARTGYYSPEEAFVGGLVHDVGRVVLARCDPELYGRITAQASTSAQVRDLERQLFGMSHALAGKRLAHRWSLPAPFEEVIGGHHAYETDALEAGSRLLRLVSAGNRFAHALTDGSDPQGLERAMAELAAPFGLEIAQAQEIQRAIWQEYSELARAFHISSPAIDPGPTGDEPRSEVDRDEQLARLQTIASAMVAPDADA
jgi:HD-like signal output (HDOD) protein